MLIDVTRAEQKVIQWLKKATSSNPSQSGLDAAKREGRNVIATDAFRMHIVEDQSLPIQGLQKIARCSNKIAELIDHDQGDEVFPNVWPIIEDVMANKNYVSISINAKLLKEAVEKMDERVILRIVRDDFAPMLVSGEIEAQRAFAVIMPYYDWGENNKDFWVPSRED